MKTSKIKVFSILLAIVALLLVFCGCQIDTELSVKPEFSGKRVMSLEVKSSDLTALSTSALAFVTADDITQVLSESCPDILKMDTQTSGTLVKTTTYTFTLEFNDYADYKEKITELLGRTPNISYKGEADEIFYSGITLKEDFASRELFDWAIEALSEKYPRADFQALLADVDVGSTVLSYSGKAYTSPSEEMNVSPELTPLELVEVETICYGQSEYSRIVSISISTENLNAIGIDDLTENFLAPLSADIPELVEAAGWNDANTYVINMKKGSVEELAQFTAAIFDGSRVSYEKGETSAFAEYGTLNESIDFSGFICNADESANVLMTYKAVGDMKFLEGNNLVLSGEDKFATISSSACTVGSFSVGAKSNYSLSGITVAMNSELNGESTVTVTLGFPTDNGKSAAEHVYEYLSEQYADTGLSTTISSTSKLDPTSGNAIDSYCVTMIASGTPEEITDTFREAFGSDSNNLQIKAENDFKLLNETEVVHTVDISSLVEQAEYDGTIVYAFEHALATIQDASTEDGSGASNPDVLGGESKNSAFTAVLYDGVFTVSFKYVQLNFIYLAAIVLCTILAFALFIAIVSSVGRRAYKKRQLKNKMNSEDAVKTVALAMLSEEELKKSKKQQVQLPAELQNRPVAVIEPRFDEGLDDEHDEPEGIIMFASAVRLLTIAVIVLFFLPFFSVSNNHLTDTISGWNLLYGKELFGTLITSGVQLESKLMTVVLLVIPALILIGLSARRFLPRLVLPIAISGAAVFEIVYLLQLPEIVKAEIDRLSTAVSYIATPSSQMAYSYSIVICALIAICGVLLMFADVAQLVSKTVDPGKKSSETKK